MLADHCQNFQTIHQLFAVLEGFFAPAVSIQQQIFEFLFHSLKGIIAFEELLEAFRRLWLTQPDDSIVRTAFDLRVIIKDHPDGILIHGGRVYNDGNGADRNDICRRVGIKHFIIPRRTALLHKSVLCLGQAKCDNAPLHVHVPLPPFPISLFATSKSVPQTSQCIRL